MAEALSAAHHAWVKDFTGGAVDPVVMIAAARAQPALTTTPLRVALGKPDGQTDTVLKLLEAAQKEHKPTLLVDGKTYQTSAAMESIGHEFQQIGKVYRESNKDTGKSLQELRKDSEGIVARMSNFVGGADPQKVGDQVQKLMHAVNDALSQADSLTASGKWPMARLALSEAIELDRQAKDALLHFYSKAGDGAGNIVKGLEITRDASFATAQALGAVTGVGVVAEIGLAVLPKVMETVNKVQLNEKINFGTLTVELFLSVVTTKYSKQISGLLGKVTGPLAARIVVKVKGFSALEPLLQKKFLAEFMKDAEKKLAEALAEKLKGAGEGGVKALAEKIFSDHKKKESTWSEVVEEFIQKLGTLDFWEKEIGGKLLEHGLKSIAGHASDAAKLKTGT